jgi:2-polyprenyl-6-methoxyphenol hydroxylase-like FAD-dependent oxidoreductase
VQTALIVGGGLGGLAAGVALQHAGWRVRVFERAATPRELGFALNLAPNAIAALGELGVADAIAAAGHHPRVVEFRAGGGRLLRRVDATTLAVEAKPVIAMRPVVHGTLLAALDSEALLLGSEAVGFEPAGDAIRVRLQDGRVEEGDVLVGADGVGSAIRRQLHPHEGAPRHSGYCALRGVVHGVDPMLAGLSGVAYFADGIEAAVIRAGGDAAYWYVSLLRAEVAADAGHARRLVERVSDALDATFARIADATRDDEMRYDELYDRDPIARWGTGRVTLLGDAAHPMLPHTGQGAAQALEDAVNLKFAMMGDADVSSALRRYEDVRAVRTSRLIRMGRRIPSISTTRNRAIGLLRDLAIRAVPQRAILAAYQAGGHDEGAQRLRSRLPQR